MDRKYVNSPIIEAVCEFRLSPDTKWDLTIPGLIYEKVNNEFPNKEQRLIQEVEGVHGPQELQHQIRTSERALFLSNDRKTFIQVGPRLLAVNCLKPYPTWDRFNLKIKDAFKALIDTVEVKGFQRIGLRYINRIEVTGQSVNLDDCFEFRPFLGQALPQQNMTSFIVGCLLPFLDDRDSCRIQLSNAVPEEPNSSAFLLDLSYSIVQPQAVPVNQTLEWVESAHQQVEKIFEGCITDNLREVFQEVK
ncbi:TIGR04255 family protein [bacterium]|nr:TIGR04255 family protein [bacterium]MBU1614049.1 TIGR04255 family protein [bacterium]